MGIGGAVELDGLADRDGRVQPALLEDDADAFAEGPLALAGIEAEDGDLPRVGRRRVKSTPSSACSSP